MSKDKKFDNTKKLCKLRKKIDDFPEEYKALVKDPKYVCFKCGRSSNSKKNLCKPREL